MCSIIGVVSSKSSLPLEKSDRKRLARLVDKNAYRGGNGAGVWSPETGLKKSTRLDAKGEIHSRKVAGSMMIHLRAATSGTVASKYNHPFVSKNIVLSHNGHIMNYRRFKVPMDSLAAVKQVRKGETAIRELSGWYVLAWFNLRSGMFHLLNYSGAIQYGFRDGRLWFSSIALREVLNNETDDVHDLASGKHVIFSPHGKTVRIQSVKDFQPKVEVIRPTVYSFTPTSRYSPEHAFPWTPRRWWEDEELEEQEAELLKQEREGLRKRDTIPQPYLPIRYRLPDIPKGKQYPFDDSSEE